MSIDPVCGMTVQPATAAGSVRLSRHDLLLLQPVLPDALQGRSGVVPEAEGTATAPPASSDALYTCPMHPEIVQHGPGACPKCGMALEPMTVSLDDGPNPELVDMTRRLWIAAALGAPVFLLTMADMLGLLPAWHSTLFVGDRAIDISSMTAINWIGLVCSTPVVLWAGWPFFERGWASIKTAAAEHVHAHRARHRRRVALQRRRDADAAGCFRRPCARMAARSKPISTRP